MVGFRGEGGSDLRSNRRRVRHKTTLPTPALAIGSVLDMGATALERRAVVVRARAVAATVRRDWEVAGKDLSGAVLDTEHRSLSKASER